MRPGATGATVHMQRVCCACTVRDRWLGTVLCASMEFPGDMVCRAIFILRSKIQDICRRDQLMSIFIPLHPVRNHCHSRSLHVRGTARVPIVSQPVVSITSLTLDLGLVHFPLMSPMVDMHGPFIWHTLQCMLTYMQFLY
jgi:hypothetical protein